MFCMWNPKGLQRDNRACMWAERYTIYVRNFLPSHSHERSWCLLMSGELQGTHDVWEWVWLSGLGRGGCWRSWKIMLSLWTRTCFRCRKKVILFKETWVTKEPHHNLSYSCYFLVWAKHSRWRWWHRRKGKDRAAPTSLSFQSFPND